MIRAHSTQQATADMQAKDESSAIDAQSLVVSLQSAVESERDRFARQLHDEVAGLIVAALMDISFATDRAVAADPSVSLPLERAKTTLKSAIDATRRMVEEMRPSMLDNFGLLTALRWELRRCSADGRLDYSESYPPAEPAIAREASIVLFRIAQYALSRLDRVSEPDVAADRSTGAEPAACASSLDLRVHLGQDSISLSVASNQDLRAADEASLTALRYRLQALGGSLELADLPAGGSVLIAQAPNSVRLG